MKPVSKKILLALTLASLSVSCGKSGSGGGVEEPQAEEAVDGATIDGIYMAKFETLNPHVNGTIPGSLTFYRKDDRLMTYVRLFAGGPRVWHMQGVYMGRKCPDMSHDSNGDGFLDIDEAMKVVGKQIIPLDSNLNSQNAGRNFYPVADLSGYYHYERVSSFKAMFRDLYEEDRDPSDHITKLAPEQPFSWENRVVIVQGVKEETALPETVAMQGRRRAFQTLPIVCGVIKKVKTDPGTLYDGTIPGPIARVEDGQDRPGENDWEVDSGAGGGTISGTTGTNDDEDGEVGDGDGNTTAGTSGGTTGGESGGASSGGRQGGFIGGFIGGRQGGGSGGTTTGGTSSGETTGGTTTGGSTTGGESSGGSTAGESGGSEGGETGEGRRGGFIGGFIGGRQSGSNGL